MSAAILVMTMCSTIFAGIVCYKFWVAIRISRLRADVLELHRELNEFAEQNGAMDDEAYLDACSILEIVDEHASRLCVPFLVESILHADDQEQSPQVKASTAAMRVAVDSILDRIAMRVVDYLFLETLGGLLLTLIVRMLPSQDRTVLRQKTMKSMWTVKMAGVTC